MVTPKIWGCYNNNTPIRGGGIRHGYYIIEVDVNHPQCLSFGGDECAEFTSMINEFYIPQWG